VIYRDTFDGGAEHGAWKCFTYFADAARWGALPCGPLRAEVTGPHRSPVLGEYFSVTWWGSTVADVLAHVPGRAP
jgi:hypothetical protein